MIIIGHQNIKRRIHNGLVAIVRNTNPFIAAPTAIKFKNISSTTRLTAAIKFITLKSVKLLRLLFESLFTDRISILLIKFY